MISNNIIEIFWVEPKIILHKTARGLNPRVNYKAKLFKLQTIYRKVHSPNQPFNVIYGYRTFLYYFFSKNIFVLLTLL